jgi:hypothetical protein
MVYLDHWALRLLADDGVYREPFLAGLRKRGTLAVSMLNSLEIADHTAGTSVVNIQRLLADAGKNVCILDIYPHGVIERAVQRGESEESAAIDLEMTKLYAATFGGPQRPLTLDRFVHWSRQRNEETRALLKQMKTEFGDLLLRGQQRHRSTGRTLRVHEPTSVIAACMAELGNARFRHPKPVPPNDAPDYFHAIVPMAICDFVLVDGMWRDLSEQVERPPRRASIYSRNTMGEFLGAFDVATSLPVLRAASSPVRAPVALGASPRRGEDGGDRDHLRLGNGAGTR